MESAALWFQEVLLPYGVLGILLLSAMDSSFVPMPAFIDLAVMGAAALSPQNAVGYAAAAVVGSTAGVMIVYGLARGGRRAAGDVVQKRAERGRLWRRERFLVAPLGGWYLAGVAGVALLLAYEQSLVRPNDLSRLKEAFDLNGYVGLFYLAATAAAIYVG